MAVLRAVREGNVRFVVTSPTALIQRLAPPKVVAEATFSVQAGAALDRKVLQTFALRTGYVLDDRIDEPGEIAFFGEVIDVFPADTRLPIRISVTQDGTVVGLQHYDPLTQRTADPIETLLLGPASELVLEDPAVERESGHEHRMGEIYGRLASLFDYLPNALVTRDAVFGERLQEALFQVEDARASQARFGNGEMAAASSGGLYLSERQALTGLKRWTSLPLDLSSILPVPPSAGSANPGRAFCNWVQTQQGAGRRVVIAGQRQEIAALGRALKRGLDLSPRPVTNWNEVLEASPGEIVGYPLDADAGFVDGGAANLAVITASDVLGGRLAGRQTGSEALVAEPDLRPGDVVLHEDHGIGVLRELVQVDVDGQRRDALRLEYHGGASILAPIEEIGRIWRYGPEEAGVGLDRLKGDAWHKRRADLSRHLDEAAAQMVTLAKARALQSCDPVVPPPGPFAKFCAKFGYPETPDQAGAIRSVLGDLGSGRPMDRLVCGDVGFGKTEVALRAAAAVALTGRQVAICAPTTVLAKQHLQTFRRRFAGTGVRVEQLSRLLSAVEASEVRAALASGDIGVVVGTHALASAKVKFADLGLLIIDEEQKFGAAIKETLRGLVDGGHRLSMTATPIPRTLQAALVGIQPVSVIASPPARRRPIRTFVAPYDAASVRTALLREKRRHGQSFVVAPRIEDIAPLHAALEELVPDLVVKVAHGELPPDEVDDAMVTFADGEGDVLLATNIIESGLDVPRANTMIIWRPDRFGLAQLHQLRGRVGRGRVQGITYLLHDPDELLSEATQARLSTLEAFDRLGSGLAISARDLDLRGGGDLIGDDQAGHIQMVGASLYHALLERAVRRANREDPDLPEPILKLGDPGFIPEGHVPDAITRINLYGRLARMRTAEEVDAFADELEDRFGVVPPQTRQLLDTARVKALAAAAGVLEVHAGPKAIALVVDPAEAESALAAAKSSVPEAYCKDHRVIAPLNGDLEASDLIDRVLAEIGRGAARR